MSDKTIRYKFHNLIFNEYVNLCNNSRPARIYYAEKGTGSSPSMKNITRDHMNNLLISLPPLHEQHRIVQKLAELMQIFDEFESCIQQNVSLNKKLLQQVLREALQRAD